MPYLTDIRCPTNGQRLASFAMWWPTYHYLLDTGVEFPLDVAYAWCHQCEHFVECERLYSLEEIEDQLATRGSSRDQWAQIDAEWAERYSRDVPPDIQTKLPKSLTQSALHAMWSAALEWRKNRRSPPRCLECGSFFAIHVLPESGSVRHPGGSCLVELSCTTHASVDGFPDHIFYNAEGQRIAQLSHDDYVKHRNHKSA
jgi:hypothetical protein